MVFQMFIVVEPGQRFTIDTSWLLKFQSLVEGIDDAD